MKIKELIQQVEHLMGRQPEGYMIRLINDGLLDIGAMKKEYLVSADTNSRYVVIPKLTDSHRLLREDTDEANDTLT